MMDAQFLCDALLGKDVTEARVLKLRRHLAPDPWRNPRHLDQAKITEMLDAIEAHPKGGELTRAFVHNALVNARPREVPELPTDIAEKVKAFKERQAESKHA